LITFLLLSPQRASPVPSMPFLCIVHLTIYLLMLFKDALYYFGIKGCIVYDDMIMNFELLWIKVVYIICYPKFQHHKAEDLMCLHG
jgi:hypothetical protein